MDKENIKQELKTMKFNIMDIQCLFEQQDITDEQLEQSFKLSSKIKKLLLMYAQVVSDDVTFNDKQLEEALWE